MKRLLLLFLAAAVSLQAQDVLFLKSGETRPGKIAGMDGRLIRLQVPLPSLPGAAPAFASVSVPIADVTSIEFARNPETERLLRTASVANLPALAALWAAQQPWLAVPKSRAGRIGSLYANLLLEPRTLAQAALAWQIFHAIETQAWSEEDRMSARQGRLRAMVACGRAQDAVEEARELAHLTENPAVIMEAKFILAEADFASLRQLVAENPRWEEDVHVIPEHARLYHQALDDYLFPALFFGSESQASARGLWGALQVYDSNGEKGKARECARDIAALYPHTEFAMQARDYVAALPEDITAIDPEREARDQQAAPAQESEPPQKKSQSKDAKPSPTPSPKKTKSKKKTDEKSKT